MDRDEDHVIRTIADPTNRSILTVLNEVESQISLQELARRVATFESEDSQNEDDEIEHQQRIVSLHHTHLPQLDEAGLLEYSPDENVVRTTTRTHDADYESLVEGLLSEFGIGGGRIEDTIDVTKCSKTVYERGREFADTAEDELFLIYTSTELLDEDCLPHARNAIDRGVDFHAGAKSEETRRFFRESLPEATIWEPQLDWLNDRSSYPKISRLIVADRTKVVVGIWDEPPSSETATEIGIVGEGANNPIVVLVRELLGPRLDHLDYQSEDFLEDLPF